MLVFVALIRCSDRGEWDAFVANDPPHAAWELRRWVRLLGWELETIWPDGERLTVAVLARWPGEDPDALVGEVVRDALRRSSDSTDPPFGRLVSLSVSELTADYLREARLRGTGLEGGLQVFGAFPPPGSRCPGCRKMQPPHGANCPYA